MSIITTAAVLRRRDQPFSIERLRLPDLRSDQILVDIRGTGLCHTDLLLRHGNLPGDWPIVLGHEGAGVVAGVGTDVTDIAVGDHVVVSFATCGACRHCREGHPAYCATFMPRNMSGWGIEGGHRTVATTVDGSEDVAIQWFGQSSFARHSIVASANAVVIDKDVPIETAGPLGCSLLTGAASVTNVLEVSAGEAVAVVGVGAVGMAAVMRAAALGADPIVVVDTNDERLGQAMSLGATHSVNPSVEGDIAEAIKRETGSVAASFDTTGNPAAIRAAVDALAPRGRCASVGSLREELVFGHRSFGYGRSFTHVIEGDAVPRVDIPLLIELWRAGRFPFEKLITTHPLTAIGEAEQGLATGRTLKAVLVP